MDSQLLSSLVDISAVLARFVSAGTVACFLAYGTVQFVIKPTRKKVDKAKGVTRASANKAVFARLSAVLIAMGLVSIFHGNAPPDTILSFGNGPAGWWMAIASGFMGGAFAGRLFDKIHKKGLV